MTAAAPAFTKSDKVLHELVVRYARQRGAPAISAARREYRASAEIVELLICGHLDGRVDAALDHAFALNGERPTRHRDDVDSQQRYARWVFAVMDATRHALGFDTLIPTAAHSSR